MKKSVWLIPAAIVVVILVVVSIVFVFMTKQQPNSTNNSSQSSASSQSSSETIISAASSSSAPLVTCTTYEKYDPQTKECYYECNNDQECAEIEAKIKSKLNGYFADVSYDKTYNEKTSPSETSQIHAFSNNQLLPPIEKPENDQVWQYFNTIASPDFTARYLTQVGFYNNSQDTTQASVIANQTNPAKWNLEINMAYADNPKELIYTLVHEFYHIFTLNDTQITTSDICTRLKTSEGCVNDTAPLQEFYTKFWKDLNADPDTNNFGQYYPGRETDFVSEYAATNVIEDFAETLTSYTLKDTSGLTGIAKQKVEFVNSIETIKKQSIQIKANLGNELKATRKLQN